MAASKASGQVDPQGARRTSRMQLAREEILRRILTLELPPGVTFTEGTLAEQLGLSKTPVREALLLIGADGLVYPQIGTGYRVAPITLKGARDLLRHRRFLDAEAAQLNAESGIASRELALFSDIVEADARRSPGDPDQARRNTAFHSVLAELTRNEELALDVRRSQLKIERMLRAIAPSARATPEEEAREHAEILHAIQLGDPISARTLAESHATATEKRVMEALLSSDSLQGINLV